MSQEKVNAYKEKKVNRKQEIEKARRKKKAGSLAFNITISAIVILLAIALVFTGITIAKDVKGSQPDYTNPSYMLESMVTESQDLSELINTENGGSVNIVDSGTEASSEEAETATEAASEAAASTENTQSAESK